MKSLPCPTCGTPVISVWKASWKLYTFFKKVPCGQCGDRVGFSFISHIVMSCVMVAFIYPVFYIGSLLPYYLIPPFIIVAIVFLFILQPLLCSLNSYGKKEDQ